MDTVIVALPPVDDKVYRISSEKVPHLTILHLGEANLSADAVLYVEHACSELSPFYGTVEHRGTLGADEADVLFFEDNGWDLKRVKEFRHWLLLNDEIKAAYDAVQQFPEWTPHLTLGYPATPAAEDDSDYPGIHSVRFDRVAVWLDDSEGPTFRLKYDDYAMEVAMSDMSTAERGAQAAKELFHYGKKGMKWGVRNDKGHEGEAVKTKKLGKLDKQWEKENTGANLYIKLHNKVADRMNNGEIDKFNNEPRWKKAADDGVLTDDNHAETKAYFDAYETLTNKLFVEEAGKLGANPSGTKAFQLKADDDGNPYAYLGPVPKDEVKHAEGDTEVAYKINRNADGTVSGLSTTELEFKHYGVKGMKWGVRNKDRAAERTPTDVTVTQKKPGTFAKTEGGKNQPLHEDAERALVARQKAKSSTTDSLSNTELRAAVERMQLEQKYSQLEFANDRRSRGAKFIAGLFGQRKPVKYRDMDEEYGEKTRDAVEKALAARAAAKVAKTAVGA